MADAAPPLHRRLLPVLGAVLVAAALVALMHLWVDREIARDLGWFKGPPEAGNFSSVALEKLTGLAVEAEAFRQPGFLPLYGSSELTQVQANRPDDFFRSRPTGFDVFPVAYPGETSLVIATKLAALGSTVRGRRAVVILSSTWFQVAELDPKGFALNFSPLHGSRIAFGGALSAELQGAFARRLLDYPELAGQFPLLERALTCEARKGAADRLLLAAMTPLGAVQNFALEESDRAKVALWLRAHPIPGNGPPPPAPASIDWDARIREAEAYYAGRPALTSYSTIPETKYDEKRAAAFRDPQHPEIEPDANFARACLRSREWIDLDLLLRTAEELDLRLLVICQPMNANFGKLQGLTPAAGELFYRRLREASAPFANAQVLTFPEAENDPHWYVDSTHPTAKAWLAYDRAIDAFYREP